MKWKKAGIEGVSPSMGPATMSATLSTQATI